MFWIVATPIGNAEDIGGRARRILQTVPVIICERPSHTLKLLARCGIAPQRLVQYTEANKRQSIPRIVAMLANTDAAFVSDAGTPAVSDPGPELVSAVRAAGIPMQCVPGPSALTAAIALSGERVTPFVFPGFFPKKQKEIGLLLDMAREHEYWIACFEAPHRIVKTLAALATRCPDAHCVLVGEISKLHEKIFSGTAAEISQAITSGSDLTKGEFVLLIRPF